MITFNTQIPVKTSNTIDDLIRLGKVWITGSPHTEIITADLDKQLEDDWHEVEYKKEKVIIARAKSDEFELGGMRYVKDEISTEWVTDIVGAKAKDEFWVSIQISCDMDAPSQKLPEAKKPVIVKQLFKELGTDTDGGLIVSDTPHLLKEDDVDSAREFITFVAKNILPIVYVSAQTGGKTYINANELAKSLAGMAHVIVEPSRSFSHKLTRAVLNENVYDGAVGIYWPEGMGQKRFIPNYHYHHPRKMMEDIIFTIREALNNYRLPKELTWAYLNEVRSRSLINKLKEQGSVEEYIKMFDAERNSKDQRLANAEQEIEKLKQELIKIGKKRIDPILDPGIEQDLYRNERRDTVLEILQEAVNKIRPDSRRLHIINDILKHNEYIGEKKKIETQIKSLLKNLELDSKTRRGMEELGFVITQDGKHYKATFVNDNRYTFSFSRTSSDHRAGKNISSDIANTLFG